MRISHSGGETTYGAVKPDIPGGGLPPTHSGRLVGANINNRWKAASEVKTDLMATHITSFYLTALNQETLIRLGK